MRNVHTNEHSISGFPAHPRSGFSVWQNGGCHSEGVGVEERSVGGGCIEVWSIGVRTQDRLVELLLEELVGWSSWFRAVTRERWLRPLAWTAPSFRAEPMCEAERTHHPAPKLERLVGSDDLRFVLFTYINTLFSAF